MQISNQDMATRSQHMPKALNQAPALKIFNQTVHYTQSAWKANLLSATLFVMGMVVAQMFKDDIRRALHLPVYNDHSQAADKTSKILIRAIELSKTVKDQ